MQVFYLLSVLLVASLSLASAEEACREGVDFCCANTNQGTDPNATRDVLCDLMIAPEEAKVKEGDTLELFCDPKMESILKCSWDTPVAGRNCEFNRFTALDQQSCTADGSVKWAGSIEDGLCNIRVEGITKADHIGMWKCRIDTTTQYTDTIDVIISNSLSTQTIMAITIPISVVVVGIIVTILVCLFCPAVCASCSAILCCCRGQNDDDDEYDDDEDKERDEKRRRRQQQRQEQEQQDRDRQNSRMKTPVVVVERPVQHQQQQRHQHQQQRRSTEPRKLPIYDIAEGSETSSYSGGSFDRSPAPHFPRPPPPPPPPKPQQQQQFSRDYEAVDYAHLDPGVKTARKVSNTSVFSFGQPSKAQVKKLSTPI